MIPDAGHYQPRNGFRPKRSFVFLCGLAFGALVASPISVLVNDYLIRRQTEAAAPAWDADVLRCVASRHDGNRHVYFIHNSASRDYALAESTRAVIMRQTAQGLELDASAALDMPVFLPAESTAALFITGSGSNYVLFDRASRVRVNLSE